MTAKEKAKELIEKFEPFADYNQCGLFTEMERMTINAKKCALISVDEILNILNPMALDYEYWEEVEQELEK